MINPTYQGMIENLSGTTPQDIKREKYLKAIEGKSTLEKEDYDWGLQMGVINNQEEEEEGEE